MARILICHVPKDGSVARDLGAALMGRGHFVSFDGEPDTPRADRSSRLRQFEVVVVIWTETSAQNASLSDIAQETLPLNLLVPVRSDQLAVARLPLMFRKLNMYTPRDIDGIARAVSRLSSAASSLKDFAASMRDKPEQSRKPGDAVAPAAAKKSPPVSKLASEPGRRAFQNLPEVDITSGGVNGRKEPTFAPLQAKRPDPLPANAPQARPAMVDRAQPSFERPAATVLTAEDLSSAVDAGLLIYNIPEAMWLSSPTTVELTLGRDALAEFLAPEAGHAIDNRQSVETISISLYGSADAFEIERQSERTQFVSPKHTLSARDPATVGRWAWLVTPRAAGPHDLVVRISALLRDRKGVPAPVALPDRRFSIDIQVPEGESLISALAGWRTR